MTARKHKPGSLLGNLLGLIGFSGVAGALVAASLAPGVAVAATATNSGMDMFQALPDYATINEQQDRNVFYANRGDEKVEIARTFNQNRQTVTLKGISQHTQNAVIAAEDRRFYSHGGTDAQSLGRAVMSQLGFGSESGGSTLTMQLVRQQIIIDAELRRDSLYDASLGADGQSDEYYAAQAEIEEQWDEDYNRKLREIKLAMALESSYTKDEILLAYLNIANFGESTYGIQAAAQEIFGINASRLSPAQSASLIATVQEPVRLNLYNADNFSANQERRDWILSQMHREGYLTEEEYEENIAIPVDEDYVNYSPSPNGCVSGHESARFFCDYVEHVMELDQVNGQHIFGSTSEANSLAIRQGGYRIYTTLDLELNDRVQDIIRDRAPMNWNGGDIGGGITMVEVNTGRILAMVQNKEYNPTISAPRYSEELRYATSLNYNVTYPYGNSGGFPPGSTYKIFTLAEWVRQGYSVNESLDTRQSKPRSVSYDGNPGPVYDNLQNNDRIEWGRQTPTDIMVNSINTGTIEMATRLDMKNIQDLASSLGFVAADNPDKDLSRDASTLIGSGGDNASPLTIAEAFQTFANDGVHCEPLAIDRIVDRDGNEIMPPQQSCERVMSSEDNSVIQHVLHQVNVKNPNTNPGGAPVISKTGTYDRVEQTWTSGASPRVATSAWIGNADQPSAGAQRLSLQPIWFNVRDAFRQSMQVANELYPGGEFTPVDEDALRGNLEQLPDVAGMPVDEAVSHLNGEGFENVEVADPVEGSNDAGTVEYTAPGAGATVAPDALITIYPSDGSIDEDDDEQNSEGRWPDLTGMSLADARSALSGAGIDAGAIQPHWHPGTSDQQCQVLAQNPEAGQPVVNEAISLVIGGRSDGSAASC